MKRKMTGFLSILLALALLAGCTTGDGSTPTVTQTISSDEPPAASTENHRLIGELVLALVVMLSLAACGGDAVSTDDPPAPAPPANTTEPATAQSDAAAEAVDAASNNLAGRGSGRYLDRLFWRGGEPKWHDTVANASRVGTSEGVAGNCQFIDQAMQEAVGGDLFAIETVQDYPRSHEALLDFAYDELRQAARPELSGEIENLDDYSVIFLGYPNWNADLPMPLYTFLAENDFDGKVLAPFCASSYSPIDNSLHIFRELTPGAAITKGLTANSESAIRPWVDQVLSLAA